MNQILNKNQKTKTYFKRILASTIAAGLMFSNVTPLTLHQEIAFAYENPAVLTGTIDCYIRFDDTPSEDELMSRNIAVTLMKGGEKSMIVGLDQGVFTKSGDNVQSWKLTFEVDAGSKSDIYSIEFTGDGHRDFLVDDINLEKTSKSITVGTSDGTFSYGDLNFDNNIDYKDISIVENNMYNENESNIIDYTKMVSLVKKIEKQSLVGSSNLISSTSFIDLSGEVVVEEMDLSNTYINGDINNIFTPNNEEPITIVVDFDNIYDSSTNITIPITISNPDGIEMSEIRIDTGTGDLFTGVANIEYIDDNGLTQYQAFEFGNDTNSISDITANSMLSPLSSIKTSGLNSRPIMLSTDVSNISVISEDVETQDNVVVVTLGTRVVVKKISISIDVDENNNEIVIKEVEFLQDIVPENPYSSDGLIENLKATGGDKNISLTWDLAQNVDGYKVSYGTSSGNYSNYETTTNNSINISVTENLVNYYFVVQSTYGDWRGTASSEIISMALPSSVPTKPTSVSVTPMDNALSLSWTSGKDASTHNVYIKHENDMNYELIASGLTSCSYKIGDLVNGETYNILISCSNIRGEGAKSDMAEGTPFKLDIDGPLLPEHNRIPNTNISAVAMRDTGNYNSSLYPNGYSTDFVWDEDYSTFWSSKNWYSVSNFTVAFNEPKDMNYIVWVPRVVDDSGEIDTNYANAIAEYTVEVFTVDNPNGETLIYNTAYTYNETVTVCTDENGMAYCVLPFEMRENIEKLSVGVWIKDGGNRAASLTELVFYEYDPIEEDINALFANNLNTVLANDVTENMITSLENRLDELEDFIVSKPILQAELDLAKSLLNGSSDEIGTIKNDFVIIDTSNDNGVKLSNISPLGLVGLARYDQVIYADIPDGDILTIYPSQFYNESGSPYSTANAIVLENGRNVVTVPDLTNISRLVEGGQWYYTYSGTSPEKASIHMFKDVGIYQGIEYVTDVLATPTLELYEYDLVNDKDIVMEKITKYINDLDSYLAREYDESHPNYSNFNWQSNASNSPLNTTEISLRHTLLSVTVTGVNSALGSSSIEERAEKLYNTALTWQSINYVTNRAYGDDIDYSGSSPISTRNGRQNVRVMRMSASAFMYAGGNHIGIQYDSVPTVIPTSSNIHPNNLGWGIAHEIGHNLDRIGILEVTNNIYSMLVATYDETLTGKYSSLNRIPWSTVFAKTASGNVGSSSDIFAQLGMYWQLHIAYADNDGVDFFSNIFGEYNTNSYTGSNKFEVLASRAANKDLTDFFTAWGTNLSDEAKLEMAKLDTETRKIQYLNEQSLELRFSEEYGNITLDKLSNVQFDINANVLENDDKTVEISVSGLDLTNSQLNIIQGFEVYKDGILIGFFEYQNDDSTYLDYFGSANNKSVEYALVMIDKLGNVCSNKILSEQVRIEYDNIIDRSEYVVTTIDNGVKLTFNEVTSVSGFRIKDSFPNSGLFNVEIGVLEYDEFGTLIEDSDISYITARSDNFGNNEASNDEKFLSYFQKQDVEADDTRIATYDAKEIIITGSEVSSYKDNLDILSYIGDNVSLTSYVMGRLSHDFLMGEDIIEEGTIIVVGEYIGDPYFNEITIEGRYVETELSEDDNSSSTSYDQMLAGDTYMFATVPDDKVVSVISDGLFIFVPEIQEDHDDHDHDESYCDHSSLFPTYIKAIMSRNDSQGNLRYTTYTSWIFCPSFDTIPDIVIE